MPVSPPRRRRPGGQGDAAAFVLDRPGTAHAADSLGDRQTRLQPVLVEARSEPGAGEPGVVDALQRPEFLLGRERRAVEDRVVEILIGDDGGGIGLDLGIQGHEDRIAGQTLQQVHPVGDAGAALAAPGSVTPDVVPRRPGRAPLRHQGRVAVHDDAVPAVANGAQQPGLFGRRLVQQGQRLIGMGGQDDGVIDLLLARRRVDDGPPRTAHDAGDRVADRQASAKLARQSLDIGPTAGLDGLPVGLEVHLEQAVVAVEADEGRSRIIGHLAGRRRPDRRRLGQQMPVTEGRAVALLIQIIAQRTERDIEFAEVGLGGAVEPLQIDQHAPEGGTEQIALLGEQPFGAVAGILEPARVHRDRERHVGGLRLHIQIVQQGGEVGVVGLIEDDEAGVDRHNAFGRLDIDRMGVAAEPVAGFVQGHVVRLGQQPGSGQTGHAGADDSDTAP
jgi:hypothetical protein